MAFPGRMAKSIASTVRCGCRVFPHYSSKYCQRRYCTGCHSYPSTRRDRSLSRGPVCPAVRAGPGAARWQAAGARGLRLTCVAPSKYRVFSPVHYVSAEALVFPVWPVTVLAARLASPPCRVRRRHVRKRKAPAITTNSRGDSCDKQCRKIHV